MDQQNHALKYLANVAYKVGYGTQRHFTTYDITMKAPLIIGLITILVGTIALVNNSLSTNCINITLIIIGVVSLYITNSEYFFKSENYITIAKQLNEMFIELGRIHYDLITNEIINYEKTINEIRKIEDDFHKMSLPNQIVFSGFIAKRIFKRKGSIKWIKEIIPERFNNKLQWIILIILCSAMLLRWSVLNG